jgi:dTDP-4-amino-4,6-dideoxygalactose transaminase
MSERLAINGGTPTVPAGLHRAWPRILPEDKAAVLAVLDRGIVGGAEAPEAVGLQQEFAAYLGARHCLATNSGTAALHLALLALDIQPGDEVITSAFSFSATAMAILHALAVPVFADIRPATYTLDPGHVEQLISPRTRAIIPVHIHGLPADLDEITAIAERHGLAVIEDACQAHGASYKGQRVGSIGRMSAFSLNYTKSFPGGEGGLFVTNDDGLARRANMFRIFGERTEQLDDELFRPYHSYVIGYNYRTQELPAAFARSQLRRLDDNNARAARNAARLTDGLAGLRGVHPPHVPEDRTHVFQKYRVRLHPEEMGLKADDVTVRDRVLLALRAEGVEAVLWHTTPLPAYPLFQQRTGFGGGRIPWAVPPADRDVVYDPADYAEATRLLNCSVLLGSERHPLCAQDEQVMDYYIAAFHKVYNTLDALVADDSMDRAAARATTAPA